MNYFDFFEMPVAFLLDEGVLKSRFYTNSKKYHPDFYTLESDDKQAEILELSTLNNKAYKTLSDFDLRMKYVLKIKGILKEEGKNQIPQNFLMEMMDINEELMELEFDFDQATFNKVQAALQGQESDLLQTIQPILKNYDDSTATNNDLLTIKDYYLKKRYLLRIRENLDKFATL